jgi:hypothetical protein
VRFPLFLVYSVGADNTPREENGERADFWNNRRMLTGIINYAITFAPRVGVRVASWLQLEPRLPSSMLLDLSLEK